MSTLAICFLAYTLVGVVLSSYFGPHINSSSNLNWADFYMIHESPMMWTISHYIILFPAVDVMSAFPLSAITWGNNLLAWAVDASASSTPLGVFPCPPPRRTVIFYRCFASVPPVIGACFVHDLGVITTYTGITGFAIIFFYPVLLSHFSEKKFKERGLDPTTFYSCVLTGDGFKGLLVVFGVFMVFSVVFT